MKTLDAKMVKRLGVQHRDSIPVLTLAEAKAAHPTIWMDGENYITQVNAVCTLGSVTGQQIDRMIRDGDGVLVKLDTRGNAVYVYIEGA